MLGENGRLALGQALQQRGHRPIGGKLDRHGIYFLDALHSGQVASLHAGVLLVSNMVEAEYHIISSQALAVMPLNPLS